LAGALVGAYLIRFPEGEVSFSLVTSQEIGSLSAARQSSLRLESGFGGINVDTNALDIF
jgi:hypothetical protein